MTKNLRDINQPLNSCSYKFKMYYSNVNLTYITGISCFFDVCKLKICNRKNLWFLHAPKTCFRGFTLNEMMIALLNG